MSSNQESTREPTETEEQKFRKELKKNPSGRYITNRYF